MLRPDLRLMVPSQGVRSPVMSFSSVDLPAPFGPTSATRDSQSIARLTFVYR